MFWTLCTRSVKQNNCKSNLRSAFLVPTISETFVQLLKLSHLEARIRLFAYLWPYIVTALLSLSSSASSQRPPFLFRPIFAHRLRQSLLFRNCRYLDIACQSILEDLCSKPQKELGAVKQPWLWRNAYFANSVDEVEFGPLQGSICERSVGSRIVFFHP
jgi:hypothetical protein